MSYFALVPTYNEEKNIREVIKRLKKFRNLKIVVVDDGSKDKTGEIAKKMGAEVLHHNRNMGKGEAIKTGLFHILKNSPEAKYIVPIDADMQYLPEEIPKIVKPLEKNEADFVTGFRSWENVPFRHRLGNFVWKTLFNVFFGTNFRDTNCGYIGMNRKAAKIMCENIYGGYILENAMFIQALKNNLRIRQVPVTVKYRKRSRVVRGMRVVSGVALFILKEGLKYRLGKR